MPDRLLLALDTTGDTFSVALRKNSEDLFSYCGGTPRQHLTELFPTLERLMAELGPEHSYKPRDIGAIAVTTGPGSFTGVRLGVLIARTLGQVLDRPIIPVNALEALALAAGPQDTLVVGLDARKSEILGAVFQVGVGTLVWREPARLMSLPEWLEGLPTDGAVVGNALARYGEDVAAARPALVLKGSEAGHVQAWAVARLGMQAWRQKMVTDWSHLNPEYIRPADVQLGAGSPCS